MEVCIDCSRSELVFKEEIVVGVLELNISLGGDAVGNNTGGVVGYYWGVLERWDIRCRGVGVVAVDGVSLRVDEGGRLVGIREDPFHIELEAIGVNDGGSFFTSFGNTVSGVRDFGLDDVWSKPIGIKLTPVARGTKPN